VLSYTNAGHNPGLLVRAKGPNERLEGQGMPLGLFPGAEYERAEVTLNPGDLVVLYTDGITEAASADGEEFSLDRLEKMVQEQARGPLVALAVAIETAVEVFAEERRFADDRTVVILLRSPGPPRFLTTLQGDELRAQRRCEQAHTAPGTPPDPVLPS